MTESAISNEPIIAPPARAYRIRFIVMFIVFVAMGGWFGYDGIVGYPQANADFLVTHKGENAPHSDMDLLFQKALMVILPIAGVGLLVWCLRRSRGVYRLEGTTLHVPGHPPVELSSITTINKKNWQRKGLAYLSYEQGGTAGTIRIDDFAYQRGPTDEIFNRIEKYLLPGEA